MKRALALLALLGCTAPGSSLEPISMPDTVPPTGLELAIDSNGRVLAAVQLSHSRGVGVEVLEERDGAMQARAWPGRLDVQLDMVDLAVGPSGEAAVAMRASSDGTTGDVLVARRAADGSWIEPMRFDTLSLPPRAYEPRVAFEASGALVLVTNQGAATRTGYGVAVSSAADATAPWTRPRDADDVISPPLFFSNAPRMVVDAHGGAIVTWYQSLGGPLRVLFSERRDGAWPLATEASTLSIDTTEVDSSGPPSPAMASDGTFAVAWGQNDGHGGIATYLALRRVGQSFDLPRSLDDRLSIGEGRVRGVVTRVAEDGTIAVAWSEQTSSGERIYLGTLAPGAERRAARVQLVSSRSDRASEPSLAVSASGALAITFVERPVDAVRIVLRRGSVDGALGDPEVLAVAPPLGAGAPRVAYGAGGRLVAGWIDATSVHLVASRP